MYRGNRDCKECGKSFRPRQYSAEFCGKACRNVFNNRRQLRGALLYDLVMIAQNATDPEVTRKAAERRVLLLKSWREADGPKRTHKRVSDVMQDTNYLNAEVIVQKRP